MPKNLLRQVLVNEQGVCLNVVDAKTGHFYMYTIPWRKLEAFVRKHGEKIPLGEMPRRLSNDIHGMMESED